MYLRDRVVVAAEPSDQAMRGLRQRTGAVWAAIERACERDTFLPNPSGLCSWCSFRELCPVFGGDPGRAEMWLAARASELSSDSLAARCAS